MISGFLHSLMHIGKLVWPPGRRAQWRSEDVSDWHMGRQTFWLRTLSPSCGQEHQCDGRGCWETLPATWLFSLDSDLYYSSCYERGVHNFILKYYNLIQFHFNWYLLSAYAYFVPHIVLRATKVKIIHHSWGKRSRVRRTQTAWVQIPAPPVTGCEMLSKPLLLFETDFFSCVK